MDRLLVGHLRTGTICSLIVRNNIKLMGETPALLKSSVEIERRLIGISGKMLNCTKKKKTYLRKKKHFYVYRLRWYQ